MDRDIELALVERLRRGDADAFDEVHQAFNVTVFTFLLRRSRRRDVAEDLLEETWLRFVKNAGRLRPDTNLGAWLFTVARHLHISYVRSRLLEDAGTASLMGLWPIGVEHVSPFEAAAASELERRIERALATLPDTSRDVLLLVGVAGLTPADAADVCGVTPDTLRQRLHRAREALLNALDRDAMVGASTAGEMTPCPNR